MPSFAPNYLAQWTGGAWTHKPQLALNGFTQDTRQLRAGHVFIALRTDKRDGHDFLSQAQAAGASAAIVARPNTELTLPQLIVPDPLTAFQQIAREHRRAFRGPIVGVTGSCGKTSTKNLIARLLGGEPMALATEGNLNNHLGVPLTLTRLEPGGHEFGVIEAGISGPGEMDTLAGMIEPDYAVVTLVAAAHTEALGGLDGVSREKATLLHYVRPGGLGVVPKQCWDFAAFQDLPQPTIVAVPFGEKIRAPRTVSFAVHASATSTEVMIGDRRFDFRRVSHGMAQNVALSIILASELGVTDDAIQHALEDWRPAKWRGELVMDGKRAMYLDFYNANPASMADALETFQALSEGREPRLFVIGCMEELGPESSSYHRQLGSGMRLKPSDRVFLIGTQAEALREGIVLAGAREDQIEIVDTLQPVASVLETFSGAVFMKGSRRYELEKALPSTMVQPHLPETPRAASGGGGGGQNYRAATFSAVPWMRSQYLAQARAQLQGGHFG